MPKTLYTDCVCCGGKTGAHQSTLSNISTSVAALWQSIIMACYWLAGARGPSGGNSHMKTPFSSCILVYARAVDGLQKCASVIVRDDVKSPCVMIVTLIRFYVHRCKCMGCILAVFVSTRQPFMTLCTYYH